MLLVVVISVGGGGGDDDDGGGGRRWLPVQAEQDGPERLPRTRTHVEPTGVASYCLCVYECVVARLYTYILGAFPGEYEGVEASERESKRDRKRVMRERRNEVGERER